MEHMLAQRDIGRLYDTCRVSGYAFLPVGVAMLMQTGLLGLSPADITYMVYWAALLYPGYHRSPPRHF